MKKNFYWFACFACATVALAFSSCNDDKIEPDIEVPTEVTGVYICLLYTSDAADE